MHPIVIEYPNPTIIKDNFVILPSWLQQDKILASSLPQYNKNDTFYEMIERYQASFYGAEYWLDEIEDLTMKSILRRISQEDVELLMNEENPSVREETKAFISSGLAQNLNFIKSSKKSSHWRKYCRTLDDCIEELSHADVIMSFKRGCRHILMRQYIKMDSEYRAVVYDGNITYIERYLQHGDTEPEEICFQHLDALVKFLHRVKRCLHYRDMIIDVCSLPDCNNESLVIEINTPPYLYGGLHLLADEEKQVVYTKNGTIPVRYKDYFGKIVEVYLRESVLKDQG